MDNIPIIICAIAVMVTFVVSVMMTMIWQQSMKQLVSLKCWFLYGWTLTLMDRSSEIHLHGTKMVCANEVF